MALAGAAGLNQVVEWVRSRGHLVLLAAGGAYQVHAPTGPLEVDASGLLRWANVRRLEADLPTFDESLAAPRHVNRKRQRGSLNLILHHR